MEGEQKLKKKELQSYPVCFLLLSLAEHYDMPFKRFCTSIPVAFWTGDEAFEWAKEMAFPCFSTVTLILPCWFLQCWQLSLLLKQRIPVITSTSTSRAGKVVEGGQTSDAKVPSMLGPSSYAAMKAIALIHTTHETRPWKSATDFPLFCREARLTWNDETHCVVFPQNMKRGHQIQPLRFFSSKWNQVTHSNECGMCLIYPRLRPEGK